MLRAVDLSDLAAETTITALQLWRSNGLLDWTELTSDERWTSSKHFAAGAAELGDIRNQREEKIYGISY